jgi:uncharacterized protein YndB with AHSA1/START domain
MIALPRRLDRTVVVRARPATVFEFFSNAGDWASWWGAGSSIDARPGGRVLIRYPNGIEVAGEVVEIQPPEHIVFTYGYVSGSPIPVGGSRVTIRLAPHPSGTLVRLTHEFADEQVRDQHVQGWRFQLSLFANAVANKHHTAAAATIDRWFHAWSDANADTRERTLGEIVTRDIRFQDRFSSIVGSDDIKAHLAAVHRFMPGMRLERRSDVRQCQGLVLADWAALTADGQEQSRGTNVFVLDADGRIDEVTGFWAT